MNILEDKYFNGEYIGEVFNPIIKNMRSKI